jgi:copper chaperone CopZ
MYRFKIKAILLFFIISIVVFGCGNTTNSSSQKEEANVDVVEKVYLALEVEGMTCGGCERTVQGALTAIEGIDSAFASHIDKQVKVLVDTNKVKLSEMQEAIQAKGYTAKQLFQ